MEHINKIIVYYLLITLLGINASCTKKGCVPGTRQKCFCPDGTVKEQVCREDGKAWEQCDCTYYTAWCDNTTGLCWQDPQKDAFVEEDIGVTQPDALRYCQELVFGGYDDWRLPTIDELRTLIRGNPATELGGECGLVQGSARAAMNDDACMPIEEFRGPGNGGCYWPPELTGTCSRPDPAAEGHPLEYCSSTVSADDPNWIAAVMFDNGGVCFNHIHSYAEVRCVRDVSTTTPACDHFSPPCTPGETRRCWAKNFKIGAQLCTEDGGCFGPCESTGFIPSKNRDVSETCDRIDLTIRVPEKLSKPPAQLMAFLYDADTWSWPPNRPPDGGTDYNQVMNPDIDVDKPYHMIVPGCTYYREKCLSGRYMLYVALMNSATMPPVMQEGDYWWGMDQEPITLGSGKRKVIYMDITLVPYVK